MKLSLWQTESPVEDWFDAVRIDPQAGAFKTDSIAKLPCHTALTIYVDCARPDSAPASLATEDGHDPDFGARWMCCSQEQFPANLSFVSIHRPAS